MLPPGFSLRLDRAVRRPRPHVLVGGSPIRVLKLSPAGAAMIDRWQAGEPVAASPGAQALAERLLDAGIAHPRATRNHQPADGGVSVVIPVRDRPEGLADTLRAIGDGPAVVVVDDASVAALRGGELGGATLIRRDSAGGPAAARNTGWRSTGAEIVVFMDADCSPTPGWLDGLLWHFADPSVGAVAPRIVTTVKGGTPRWLGEYEMLRSSLDQGSRESPVRPGSPVPYVPTAALAVRRTALEQIGGFDESLRFGEDVDLVWRLAKNGWRVRYEPSVLVGHPARTSAGAWLRQRYEYGLSAAPLAARHGRDVAPLAVSPWSAAAWGFAASGHPMAGAAIAGATTAALARRAGRDAAVARVLVGLGATGNVRAGSALAGAVRRAWLSPAVLGVILARSARRRKVARAMAVSIAASFALPPAVEWAFERPGVGLLRWSALRTADDLAYQAGVWVGAIRGRSGAALLPRW